MNWCSLESPFCVRRKDLWGLQSLCSSLSFQQEHWNSWNCTVYNNVKERNSSSDNIHNMAKRNHLIVTVWQSWVLMYSPNYFWAVKQGWNLWQDHVKRSNSFSSFRNVFYFQFNILSLTWWKHFMEHESFSRVSPRNLWFLTSWCTPPGWGLVL